MKKTRTFLISAAALILALLLSAGLLFRDDRLSASADSTYGSDFMKILFVDCGRKYFSVDSIKSFIDEAADAGLTHVQLALGNEGLRFLLDDLSLTVGGTSYTSEQVTAGIKAGNSAYYNFTVNELTESDMDTIIAYAKEKKVGIIPCVNSPGHMDAILDCMEYCGLGTVSYGGSARTVDVTNASAVAFTQALLKKYAEYFAAKGCTYFNMGADEYANDVYSSGSMGFGNLISTGKYGSFVSYVNEVSAMLKQCGLAPMAFNDGIYFNNTTSYGSFDTDIVICYWSSGWSGYTPMSASELRSRGFRMVNTNSTYYWVLGKSDWQCSASTMQSFSCTAFQGSTVSDPAGAMFCIWCDYPGAATESSVISSTSGVISAFGAVLPEIDADDPWGEESSDSNVTEGNPFPKGTAGSQSFRIPSLVTLSDGTLVAAADARWNTVYDGGGLDTLTSYSTDGGESWHWSFANYLGDNGDSYNGSGSTAFIDPCMLVADGDVIYLLCDLYPYGVALNGSGNTQPSTASAFDSAGNLLLAAAGSGTYSYYLDLTDYKIYSSSGSEVTDYTVDKHFNITGSGVSSNLFYADSPFTVVRTGYLYLVSSSDQGRTWSDPTLLNLKTSSEMACLVSPGNSIQTSDGTLIFPVYSYNGSNDSQRVSFLYSSDGKSWKRSSSLNYTWGSESECVELSDGTLRFFFRNENAVICYADAKKSGDSYVWSAPVLTGVYVNSNTQISALSLKEKVDGKQAILLSAPAGPGSTGSVSSQGSDRVNGKILTALVNEDLTLDFQYSYSVSSKNSQNQFLYSCLTETADGKIALLYEDYSNGWGSGDSCYAMLSFDTFEISDLAQGASVTEALKTGRAELDFNEGWKFYLGDVSSAYAEDFSDEAWEDVTLPHDFSISQDFSSSYEAESGFLPGGTGWYRKSFTLPSGYDGKSLLLCFDGVYQDAYVYVNGSYVGEHHYGYSSFAFDLSGLLVCDGSTVNVIAVKAVNNVPSSRYYSGSGIYRDVTLLVTGTVHTESDGTKITTPDIETGSGTVAVSTELKNESASAQSVTVSWAVLKKDGETVLASGEKSVSLAAGSTETVSGELSVADPLLWSPSDPELYTLVTRVSAGTELIDSLSTDFGFRWYSFDSDKGFYLNGEALKLNGVCLHHDQGALGSAAYTDSMRRQLLILKDMGVNAVRTTHNPADEDFIRLCDELGLLVIEEFFDGWAYSKNGNSYDFSRYFDSAIGSGNALYGAESTETWAEYVVHSVVRRDRNSPSVILWSLGNEIFEGSTADSNAPAIAKKLIDWVKEDDVTRPTTLGDNSKASSTSSVLGQVLQVIIDNGGIPGFNYASASQLSALHSAWGAIFSSETSSATNSRGIYVSQNNNSAADGKYHLTSYDTSAVSWGMTAHDSLYNTLVSDYIAGEFVWTGFDYIGEPTPYNGVSAGSVTGSGAYPNSSYFGIVDTAGFVKDTYYFYRSQWNQNANTLHLVTAWDSSNMLVSSGKTPVVLYTNAAKAELYLNGTLIGTAVRTVHTGSAGHSYYTYTVSSADSSVCTAVTASGADSLYAAFNVSFTAGTLSAKAYDENGKEITASCAGQSSVTTPGAAAEIALSADTRGSGDDGLIYLAMELLDAAGNPVSTAVNTLNISVTGGVILGVDNGDQATTQKYQQSSVLLSDTSAVISAYAGKALVIVRGGEDTVISVSSDGLPGASFTAGGGAEQELPENTVDVALTVGESLTLTDESGNYESSYQALLLDSAVAEVSVEGTTIPGSEAVSESFSQLTGFSAGSYLIGYVSGDTKYFLTASGTGLGYTSSASEATLWSISGSSSSLTISAGGYYLCHTGSNRSYSLTLSTSASNGSWVYNSSSGLYFTSSSGRSTAWYLVYSSGFTLKSSSSGGSSLLKAYPWTFIPGSEAVEAVLKTEITFTGVSPGETRVIVGETLYRITVREGTVRFLQDTDGIDSGAQYVIADASGLSLCERLGYLSRKGAGAADNAVTEPSEDMVWVITAVSGGYTIRNLATGQYLACEAEPSPESGAADTEEPLPEGGDGSRAGLYLSSEISYIWYWKAYGESGRFCTASGEQACYLYFGNGFRAVARDADFLNLTLYKKEE